MHSILIKKIVTEVLFSFVYVVLDLVYTCLMARGRLCFGIEIINKSAFKKPKLHCCTFLLHNKSQIMASCSVMLLVVHEAQ